MLVKFVLILAWSANGVGFTAQEFDSQQACEAAKAWATEAAKVRGGLLQRRVHEQSYRRKVRWPNG